MPTQYIELLILLIPVVLGVLGYTWTKIIIPTYIFIKKLLRLVEQTDAIPPVLLKISENMTEMRKELTTNGGTSIKDAVRRIEEHQNLAEARYMAHLNTLANPIFECDNTGKLLWVNRSFLELVDVQTDDLLENGWINFVHVDDREKVTRELEFAIKQHRDYYGNFRFVVKDSNEIVPVICKMSILRGKTRMPVGYTGVIHIKA